MNDAQATRLFCGFGRSEALMREFQRGAVRLHTLHHAAEGEIHGGPSLAASRVFDDHARKSGQCGPARMVG
jgi:hypothetical protein